jgi:hypothetical protein
MPKPRRLTTVYPPSPIINRRTGAETPFGPRRAFDGAYMLELLAATGCTKADIEAAIFVLQPLIDHGFGGEKADSLVELLQDFWAPPTPALRLVDTVRPL